MSLLDRLFCSLSPPAPVQPLVVAVPVQPAARRFDRDVMPAIVPDLIPASSWGSSLSNLLTRTSWSAVRMPVVYRKPCQICGDAASGGRRFLDCHELWSYSMPPPDAGDGCVGVQRLIGIVALCQPCHEMFHIGLARVRGREPIVRERMLRINRWSADEYQTWVQESGARALARNKRGWVLDVSLIKHHAPLVIDQDLGWIMRDDGILYRPPYSNPDSPDPDRPETFTAIFGCSYEIGGVLHEAVDPGEAYEGLLGEAGDFDFARAMT